MATKPKAILSTHDGREASPITKASNVLFENGQTAQDILNDRQDAMISPVIENSSSMFKVGQGDNVDYSANVVNGAYESMVLKGKSMVNCIQEPSSQDVVLPYEFADGQYVTINDTKESGALGIQMKGQTLVNIHDATTYALSCQSSGWYDNYVSTKNEVSFTITDTTFSGWRYINLGALNLTMLKPNTKYLVVFSEAKNITTVRFLNSNGSKQLSDEALVINGKAIVTTKSNMDLDKQVLYIYFNMQLGEVVVKNAMIIEYQEGMENWDIPYFEGMTSCKMPILHTVGKNLFDKTKAKYNTSISSVNGLEAPNSSYVCTDYIQVSPNTNYVLNTIGVVNFYDSNKNLISVVNNSILPQKITTPTNCKYIRARNYELLPSLEEQQSVVEALQIEQGTQTTSYEPYKSSILSLPEEVVLRSLPNGVCDTFNTRTGVYTQRIGEVVLDNSQTYLIPTGESFETIQRFKLVLSKNIKTATSATNGIALCDKLKIEGTSLADEERMFITTGNSGSIMYFNLLKTKATNLTELQSYLQSNPITVQYELETPIVTKINLPSTLKSWNTTTHIHSEIPENSLYPILSHSNPSYPVILKPSTKYSIVANSYSNNHTNSAINFNLGGSTASTTVGNRVTTITTPSILSNELLTMSGRGNKLNNVMVIEGDVVGDESYFEGICDCKSPILSNVGKNLVNVDNYVNYPNENLPIIKDGEHSYIIENKKVGNWQNRAVDKVKLKANTTYTLSYDYELLSASVPMNYGVVINLRDDSDTSINISGDVSAGKPRTFTPTRDTLARLCMYATDTSGGMNRIKFSNIQLEESSNRTEYEPYKSNILSCNGDKIELTEDMFEQGSIGGQVGKTYDQIKSPAVSNRIRSKSTIKVKPNTTYSIKCKEGYIAWFSIHDANDLYVTSWGFNQNASSLILTTSSSTYGLGVIIQKPTGNITPNEVTNVQLHEVDKTIVLRSLPNDVCDTLNVETGEYVQRIGEVVLDGSQSRNNNYNGVFDSVYRIGILHSEGEETVPENHVVGYCDKLNNIHDWEGDYEHFYVGKSVVMLYINKEKIGKLTDENIKAYLSQNPITVQYELATPIVTTIDIQGFPYAYENGHVQLSSGSIEQSLTPKVEYSVVTNRNGQIRSNQKMVERHQKQLDQLQAIILANLVNSQYNQTLTTLKYELSRV